MSSVTDHRGQTLNIGDRVVAIEWGGAIPLWLSNTPGTIVAIGRSRITVRFDSSSDTRSVPARSFRRLS